MSQAKIRLLFADDGTFHHEELTVEASVLEGYERLIDALREEPAILREHYIDVERLVSATRLSD